ncbi:tRNA-(MS[2]IO[6]A)-hydroxylase (MiaE)-like [Nocardioides scoriae]|uniref:tRNA-(MS[2]IO[6]A)-hydroxylase (MiaE)-like n=1 Tax=Nocardioides scoriae TaxID=642780 RepID=A0A1H1XGC9_9ACTN|nr:ferritin-like fold-containing protein [Nocardioides scoriae]SDT07819.1 tRNA-(MS[2]IO[6]A)-hydroxylase (MiaE)-like [Nocardioides scoriae]
MTEPSRDDTPDETPGAADEVDSVAFEDPAYRAAVVDLLGVITYGEISAFERLADDAKLAPRLADKLALRQMATVQFGHVQPLMDRIATLGADPIEAMAPFTTPFDVFHAATAPNDWLEGLVKAYVGDGLAADFYVEIAMFLDAGTRQLVIDSLAHAGQADFVVDRVRRAIEDDHRVGGRLALWGRRLMGEALSQAQRVAAERDSLAALLAGGVDRPGMDLAALARMFSRLTENHAKRMAELGLAS